MKDNVDILVILQDAGLFAKISETTLQCLSMLPNYLHLSPTYISNYLEYND